MTGEGRDDRFERWVEDMVARGAMVPPRMRLTKSGRRSVTGQ
jgi:hypothetical protein